MSSYYTTLRKTTKWYKKIAVEILLGTCVVNAFVIFNESREVNRRWDMCRFREEIIKNLVKEDGIENNPLPNPEAIAPKRVPKKNHRLDKRPGPVMQTRQHIKIKQTLCGHSHQCHNGESWLSTVKRQLCLKCHWIILACLFRGLNPANMKKEDMEEWLEGWLQVSQCVRKDSRSLLLHSPVLLAYNHPSNWVLLH
ncbi:LETM1 domain containing 1 [Homalodisca vitripennis]|nr:LETM1 domain containing 1 [Homalodisca vitripennis]